MKRGPAHLDMPSQEDKRKKSEAPVTVAVELLSDGSPNPFQSYRSSHLSVQNSALITELKSLPKSQYFLLYGLEKQRDKYRRYILPILRERMSDNNNSCKEQDLFLTIDDIHKKHALLTEAVQDSTKKIAEINYDEFGPYSFFAKEYLSALFGQLPTCNLLKNQYIRVGCQLAIRAAQQTGIQIYFLVDGIDVRTAIDPSIMGFTSAELRHIHRLYKEDPTLVRHVRLYAKGEEISKEEYFSGAWDECRDDHIEKSTALTPLKMIQNPLPSQKTKSKSKLNNTQTRKRLNFL